MDRLVSLMAILAFCTLNSGCGADSDPLIDADAQGAWSLKTCSVPAICQRKRRSIAGRHPWT